MSFFFVVVKKVSPSLPSPSLPLSVPSVHRAGWPLRGPEEGLGVSVHQLQAPCLTPAVVCLPGAR